MSVVCYTDDSHDISNLVFSEKLEKKYFRYFNISSAPVLIDGLRIKSIRINGPGKLQLGPRVILIMK